MVEKEEVQIIYMLVLLFNVLYYLLLLIYFISLFLTQTILSIVTLFFQFHLFKGIICCYRLYNFFEKVNELLTRVNYLIFFFSLK